MKHRQQTAFAQLLLYGELILALLVLTAVGAKLYGSTLAAKDAHSHQRLALSYVQSQAMGFTGDALQTAPGPQGDMLVLREADGGFETRIYVYEGNLCSEFSPVGSDCAPDSGQVICPLSRLTLRWDSPTLLHLDADGMQGDICSRGGQNHVG